MAVKHSSRRNIITLAVIVLAFCLFLPRLSSFGDSISTLRNADFVYFGTGLLIWISTFFFAALVYKFIALKPIPFGTTLLVQLASGFTNRVAPMGAGILALNISYLVKRGHTGAQAGAIATLNNLLGFIGTLVLILSILVLDPATVSKSFVLKLHLSAVWITVAAVVFIIGIYLLATYGKKLLKGARAAVRSIIKNILRRPINLILALAASMMITAGYSVTLYVIGLACNAHFSLSQGLIIMTLGVVAASVTPTPGGVGGAEVGLVLALIAAGITDHQALTVALLYRFLTFWLPIIPGFICFQIVLRKNIFRTA